jgi:Tfp pilus assembly protein PilN
MQKHSNSAFVNQMLVGVLVVIGTCGSVGLGMVGIRHQISILANENKAIEARTAAVERRCTETSAAIAAEQDPSILMQRNDVWHLALGPARAEQVQRVDEDPVMRMASKHNRGLFDTGATPVTFRIAAQP